MTTHSASSLRGSTTFRLRPAPVQRRASRVIAVRDVRDVEALVIDALDETDLPLTDRDLDELVPCGIESVLRVEQALSPERPLLPVLDGLLSARLAERWRCLQREQLESAEPAAA